MECYRARAREYVAAVNSKDMDRLLAGFSEDAEVHDPKCNRLFSGKDQLRAFYEGVFTRARLEIVEPIRRSFGNGAVTAVIAYLSDSRVTS